MVSTGVFILDTSSFIEPYRRFYAFDIAPAFWAALLDCAREGMLTSLDVVHAEITGGDGLGQWAASHAANLFRSSDDSRVTQAYTEVMSWVSHSGQYLSAAKAKFASGADGWIVAFAMALGHTVVTQEVSSPLSRTRVKIPDACAAMNVPCVDTFQMLRLLGVRLDGFSR